MHWDEYQRFHRGYGSLFLALLQGKQQGIYCPNLPLSRVRHLVNNNRGWLFLQ